MPLALDPVLYRDPKRDCRSGGGRNNPRLTLIAWYVEHNPGRKSNLQALGWWVLDPQDFEDAAAILNLSSASVAVNELRECARRRSFDLVALGDGQYRVRLTTDGEVLYRDWLACN